MHHSLRALMWVISNRRNICSFLPLQTFIYNIKSFFSWCGDSLRLTDTGPVLLERKNKQHYLVTTLTTWFRSELWFWSHDSLYFLSMRLCSQAGFNAEELDSLHKKLNWEFCSKSASVLMSSLVSEPKNPSGMQQKASDPCRGLTTT